MFLYSTCFQPRTESEQARAVKRLLKRQQVRKRKLEEAGIEYDFDAVSYVSILVIPTFSALTPFIEKASDGESLIFLTLSSPLFYIRMKTMGSHLSRKPSQKWHHQRYEHWLDKHQAYVKVDRGRFDKVKILQIIQNELEAYWTDGLIICM